MASRMAAPHDLPTFMCKIRSTESFSSRLTSTPQQRVMTLLRSFTLSAEQGVSNKSSS